MAPTVISGSENGAITETDGTSVTLSGYSVPAGDNKILIVISGDEDNTSPTADPSSVTHNGVALTKAVGRTLNNNNCSIWYLLLGSTTPSGDIVATWGATKEALGLVCFVIQDAAQEAPEATNSATSTSSPVNTSITTLTDDALVIDGLVCGAGRTYTTTQAGQTEINEQALTTGQTLTVVSSNLAGGTAGSKTLGWSASGSVNRLVHCLAAFKPAAAGGETIALAAAGAPWTGRSVAVNARQNVALSPAAAAWAGRNVSLNERVAVLLTAAGAPWSGRDVAVNAQEIIDLIIAAAGWAGLSVKVNEAIALAPGAVAWTGLDVNAAGAEIISLTAAGVTWTGRNVTVRIEGAGIARILRQTMAYPGDILRTILRTPWNVRDG